MQLIDLVPDLRPTILAARAIRDMRNTLTQWLPYQERQAVSYKLGRRRTLNQTVPVRAIDTPATPILRPGVVTIQGDLPAVTPIIDLSEQDLTNEMIIAQQLAGQIVDFEPAVQASAGIAAATVDNTYEAMRGQLLSTLKITLTSADGAVHEVDFGADPGQIVPAADPWTDPDADPFADLLALQEAHTDRAGLPAAVMLTSRKVIQVMLHKLMVKYPNSPIGTAELHSYLANNGLPRAVPYDRVLVAANGTKTRVFPQSVITLLPEPGDPVGRTELGVTQEAVQQVQNRVLAAAEAPGITIVTLGRDNPVQRAVKAAAIGMPVLADADQVTVLTGVV